MRNDDSQAGDGASERRGQRDRDVTRLICDLMGKQYAGAHGVIWAGSTARGEATPTSDIDLLVIVLRLMRVIAGLFGRVASL